MELNQHNLNLIIMGVMMFSPTPYLLLRYLLPEKFWKSQSCLKCMVTLVAVLLPILVIICLVYLRKNAPML